MKLGGYLIAFLLGMAAMVAMQGRAETWVVLNGLAQHLDRGGYCNNHVTKGLGLEQNGWQIGFYDNSNCQLSAYAAKSWLPLYLQFSDSRVRAGVIVGAVSGYADVPLPAVGLAATYERERWGANLIFIPPMSESSVGVLWLQGKVRWR